jgi:hypothetical protein
MLEQQFQFVFDHNCGKGANILGRSKKKMGKNLTQPHSVAGIDHEDDALASFELVLPQTSISRTAAHVVSGEQNSTICARRKKSHYLSRISDWCFSLL